MLEKVIEVPGISKYHTDSITESTGINVSGPNRDYVYISEFHTKSKNVTYIGEFLVEEDIIDEGNSPLFKQISSGKKIINYQIYVYSNEGPIPHFHIIDSTGNNRSKDICICIFSANYFSHGKHADILNSKELRILDNFLRIQIDSNTTNWDYIKLVWRSSNPEMVKKYPDYYKIDKQPDYTNITTFIENPKFY